MFLVDVFTLVVASALCAQAQDLGEAAATLISSSTLSCSRDELQHVQTQIASIRASLESASDFKHEATSVLSPCKAALTFELWAASNDTKEECATDCISWIEDVVDAPTCEDVEMLTYQRRLAAYLNQCNEQKQVRLQEKDTSTKLRGLAESYPEDRKLGVKGLMDALLVVTLNEAL